MHGTHVCTHACPNPSTHTDNTIAASAFLVPSAAVPKQQQQQWAAAPRLQQPQPQPQQGGRMGLVMLSPGKPNLGKGAC